MGTVSPGSFLNSGIPWKFGNRPPGSFPSWKFLGKCGNAPPPILSKLGNSLGMQERPSWILPELRKSWECGNALPPTPILLELGTPLGIREWPLRNAGMAPRGFWGSKRGFVDSPPSNPKYCYNSGIWDFPAAPPGRDLPSPNPLENKPRSQKLTKTHFFVLLQTPRAPPRGRWEGAKIHGKIQENP